MQFCRPYQPLVGLQESPRGHPSLLGQALTACGLSVHHVSLSPSLEPEANVCFILLRHSQQTCHTDLISPFGSSSQIGKVRHPSHSIRPNSASLSTMCAYPRLLVLFPRRVHDAVVRSSLNPSRGGQPLFFTFCARIFANSMIFGNRFTQYGRRRKRSVSLLLWHARSSFRLTTFRPFSSLFVHSGTVTIS